MLAGSPAPTHVRVPRTPVSPKSTETSKDDVESKVKDTLTKVGLDTKNPNRLSQDELINAIADILSPTLESTEIMPIMEEINRFKQLIK